jgi:pimeloyl-ACP methyl ester carboxylesterase
MQGEGCLINDADYKLRSERNVMQPNDQEKIIKIKPDVEICTESFGDTSHPAILLIMGASASMVWWDEEFCRGLADRGRFVIRYDNRDVGRSTVYRPGAPQYTVEDLADDAVKVLDDYGIHKAHLVGMSLGGMIAQLVALRDSQRVLTLTLMMSSVWDDNPNLPPIDKKVLEYHAAGTSVNWSDAQTAIPYMVEGWQLLSGSKHQFNAQRTYQLAEIEFNRARNLVSMFNHALLQGGEAYYGKMNDIKAPTLIIHGTEDPVLPYAHGQALAESIAGATLLALEGVGHEIPKPEWNRIIDAIITHTKSKA